MLHGKIAEYFNTLNCRHIEIYKLIQSQEFYTSLVNNRSITQLQIAIPIKNIIDLFSKLTIYMDKLIILLVDTRDRHIDVINVLDELIKHIKQRENNYLLPNKLILTSSNHDEEVIKKINIVNFYINDIVPEKRRMIAKTCIDKALVWIINHDGKNLNMKDKNIDRIIIDYLG
jgi:hypothetical protein